MGGGGETSGAQCELSIYYLPSPNPPFLPHSAIMGLNPANLSPLPTGPEFDSVRGGHWGRQRFSVSWSAVLSSLGFCRACFFFPAASNPYLWPCLQHSSFRRHPSTVSMMVCLAGTGFSAPPGPGNFLGEDHCTASFRTRFPVSYPWGGFTAECWWTWLLPLNSVLSSPQACGALKHSTSVRMASPSTPEGRFPVSTWWAWTVPPPERSASACWETRPSPGVLQLSSRDDGCSCIC